MSIIKSIEEYFQKKYLMTSFGIHVSIFLSFLFNNLSSYVDYKNKMIQLRKEEMSQAFVVFTKEDTFDENAPVEFKRPKIADNNQPEEHQSQEKQQNELITTNSNIIIETPVDINEKDQPQQETLKSIKQNNINQSMTQEKPKENKNIIPKKSIKKEIRKSKIIKEDKKTGIKQIIAKEENYENQNQEKPKDEIFEIDGMVDMMYGNNNMKFKDNADDASKDSLYNYKAVIEYHIEKCWSKYSMGFQENGITVALLCSYNEDGHLIQIKDGESVYDSLQITQYEIMKQNAIKAINECSPIKLDSNFEHDRWKEIEFRFRYNSIQIQKQ